MKTRAKRLLALVLCLAILLTGHVLDYRSLQATDSNVENVNTNEWDYNINFEMVSVKDITDFTSTKFDSANNYSVVEQDRTMYDHWYTGKEDTDEYGRSTGYVDQGATTSAGNRSAGLKALTGAKRDYRYLASYNKQQYADFEVKAEIHSNLATDGIAFGQKNVFAASEDSSSARVYFTGSNTGGRLKLEGAFDYKTYKVTGNSADTANLGYNVGAKQFTFHYNGTNISRGQVFELHVKKVGTTVTIWVEGYTPILTIELADTWEAGPVSLCSNGTHSGGGFKSFAIKKAAYSIDFENVSAKNITDFTSTKFDSSNGYSIVEQDKTVYEHWFTGTGDTDEYGRSTGYVDGCVSESAGNRSAGLKPLTGYGKAYRYLATYKGTPNENYEITAEIHSNLATDGIAFGEKNVFPASEDSSSARVYFTGSNTGGRLYLEGAFDYSSYTVTGNEANPIDLGFSKSWKRFTFSTEGLDRGEVFELHIRKQGKLVTIWAEGYAPVLTIELANSWKEGPVSLCSHGTAPGGGFKSFSYSVVEGVEIIDKHKVNVDFMDKDLDTLSYTSTQFDKNNKYLPIESEIDQPLSKHWFTGNADKTANGDKTPYAEAGTPWGSRNHGAKSIEKLDANKYTYMNFGQSYDNFQAELEIINGSYHGIAFGKKNEFYSVSGSSSVGIYLLNQRIQLEGAVVYSSAEVTGDATWATGGGVGAYKFTSEMPKNEIYKLHIKVSKLDDLSILEVWVEGYDSKLTIELSNKYQKEEIALVSRSFQGDCGGIKSFVLDEIESDLIRPDKENGFQTLEQVEEKFDAYYLADASKTTKMNKVNLAEHWRLSRYGSLSRANNVTDSSLVKDVEVLTYTAKQYNDFELTYTYQQTYARLGVMIGTKLGEYPIAVKEDKKVSDNGAIFFVSAEGKPYVSGKLSAYTSMKELWYSSSNPESGTFVEPDATSNVNAGKEHTVKIVVKNRELYAYLDGSTMPCLYVDLGASYQGGYVSLISHAKDSQGFKSFTITDRVTTQLPSAGGVVTSGNTVTATFDDLKFDSSQFTAYYMEARKDNEQGDMQQKAFKDIWSVVDGTLNRYLTLEDGAEGSKVTALTYNKPLTDFVVSFEYQKYGRYPMFMFGTEKGKYALRNDSSGDNKNGGAIVLLENDLGATGGVNMYGDMNPTTESYRPMARQKRIFEGYADAPRGSWHTVTIAVMNKQLYVYLDNYGLVTTWALSEDYDGGYISFMATGNAYGLDNLKITDLSSMSENSVVSMEGVRDITVPVGTSLAQIGLPTTMDVKLKNGTKKTVSVHMINMNYDGTKEGVYQFTAMPVEGNGVTNEAHLSVTVNVRVVENVKKGNAAVKEWTFDTSDDLKDFKEFYIKNAESGYVTSNIPKWYVSNDGKLMREPWKMPNGDLKNELVILSYAAEQYKNFELEVEFKQYVTRTMVMFGSKEPGAYIDLNDYHNKDNPVLAFVELEGVRTFVGNVVNTDYYNRTDSNIYHARESGIRLKDYYDAENTKEYSGKWHKMKLRVVGDQALLWVDDNPNPYTVTLTDYDGGYISLVSNRKDSAFDNLKITRLDEQGNVLGRDPAMLANGNVSVTTDDNASSELVIPEELLKEKVSEEGKDVQSGVNKKKPAKKFMGMAASIVLAAVAIDGIMIVLASRKKK